MIMDEEAHKNFLREFEELCQEYAEEDIDADILKKEVCLTIDNYS